MYFEPHAIRSVVSLKPISSKKLKDSIHILTKKVEPIIAKMLPDKFGLIFDGWSAGGTNFVAIFATFTYEGERKQFILSFSPLLGETSQDALQHLAFLESTLQIYGKYLSNVCCLIGDNCATNKAFLNSCGIPLIGC